MYSQQKNSLTKKLLQSVLLLSFAIVFASCANEKTPEQQVIDRIKQNNDGAPAEDIDLSQVKNAVPKIETWARYGNHSPYYVLGSTYEVMDTNENFTQEGTASWYGTKFHGRLTSSREPYDMIAMTAAHKTLPLPSYVKVTNLENQKEIIVKVNDRGPFVGDRIIDLSYAAAHKIEMHIQGTAKVKIEVLPPFLTKPSKVRAKSKGKVVMKEIDFPKGKTNYLQIGVFGSEQTANDLQASLVKSINNNVLVIKDESAERKLFKVRIGPIADYQSLSIIQETLIQRKLPHYYLISE